MSAQPNQWGVYQAQETIELSGKGYMPLACIRLVDLGAHWLWATCFSMPDGSGSSSPLMDFDRYRAPDRAGAVTAASEALRRDLHKRAETDQHARAVIDWLDSLAPAQLDLFGAAA